MKMVIVRDDGVMGINNVFKRISMATLPANIRAVQWNGNNGHIEYDDMTNEKITSIDAFQSLIDLWNAPDPILPEPPASERIAAAIARINAAYEIAVRNITSGYSPSEVASWFRQETEARAWDKNSSTPTPFVDAAAAARGITKADMVSRIITLANVAVPALGTLTGKRQGLQDRIAALGTNPTQSQLDAVQW